MAGSSSGRKSSRRAASSLAALDAQGPLPHGGQEPRRLEPLGDVTLQAQPVQARPGEDHGVELALEGLVEPGLDVAPDGHHVEVGPQVEELGAAAERAGAHPGPLGERAQGPMDRGDQGVGHVLARGHGGQGQALGAQGRQVLEAVHGQVDRAVQERPLDLLGEQAGPADRGQGRVPVAVAVGLDLDQLDGQAGMAGAQAVGDPVGLPAGQAAAAGADPDPRRAGWTDDS